LLAASILLVSFAAADDSETDEQVEKALRFLKITYNETTKYLSQITFSYVLSVWVVSHCVIIVFCLFIFHRTMKKRRANKENITLKEIITEKYPLYFIYGLISEE
jgi:Na+/melibiose symporter-like transporter